MGAGGGEEFDFRRSIKAHKFEIRARYEPTRSDYFIIKHFTPKI